MYAATQEVAKALIHSHMQNNQRRKERINLDPRRTSSLQLLHLMRSESFKFCLFELALRSLCPELLEIELSPCCVINPNSTFPSDSILVTLRKDHFSDCVAQAAQAMRTKQQTTNAPFQNTHKITVGLLLLYEWYAEGE
jgi:hypothetical protein